MSYSWLQSGRLRVALAALATLCIVLAVSFRRTAIAADSSVRRPVLVELFTSEGCSSCPPADELLARLDAQQLVPGAQVIVLSEHVTYWNQEGWRDPYSLDTLTDRQQQYGNMFSLPSIYTPQAVVDGAAQVTGSDGPALGRAIAKAAATPALDLAIEDAGWSAGAVHFKVRVGAGHESSGTLMAALAEDSAESQVKRGENAGRTLRHVAVVRVMKDMGKGALDGRPLELKAPNADQSAQQGPMRLVVFVADRRSGRVLGVAEQRIAPQADRAAKVFP
jgi:hypothetical protein